MELAKRDGKYESFDGSPASQGKLQFDLWGVQAKMYDWDTLKKDIQTYGMRNSLLLAPMPTASSAQILGNNETFEAFTSNLYSRRVLSGEFICINKHLIKELVEKDLWNTDIQNRVMATNGSIQSIKEIPQEIRSRYRTIWELSQKKIIDMAVGRSPFIDQSQSLNIFIATPTYQKISSMHFYGWKKGLKTGMYYLRSRPAVDAIKFTVDVKTLANVKNEQEMKKLKDSDQINKREDQKVCRLRPKDLRDDEDCMMCGS